MRLSKHHRTKLEINMTPMIDVTFLLLIFFMTVNQVSKANREKIPLPQLAGTQDQSDATLIINVDRGGQIIVASEPSDLGALAEHLKADVARVGNDTSRVQVLIRGHREADCRTINAIVRMLNKFQIGRVNMGVEVPP